MPDQLQKAINLVKKTGDKLIVFDSAKPDNTFVILALKDYENLVLGKSEVRGLTEDELLDKINRDIAIWKSEQALGESESFSPSLENFSELPIDNKETDETGQEREKSFKGLSKSWSIPSKRKMKAEEIIEEDRQYLEDLAF